MEQFRQTSEGRKLQAIVDRVLAKYPEHTRTSPSNAQAATSTAPAATPPLGPLSSQRAKERGAIAVESPPIPAVMPSQARTQAGGPAMARPVKKVPYQPPRLPDMAYHGHVQRTPRVGATRQHARPPQPAQAPALIPAHWQPVSAAPVIPHPGPQPTCMYRLGPPAHWQGHHQMSWGVPAAPPHPGAWGSTYAPALPTPVPAIMGPAYPQWVRSRAPPQIYWAIPPPPPVWASGHPQRGCAAPS